MPSLLLPSRSRRAASLFCDGISAILCLRKGELAGGKSEACGVVVAMVAGTFFDASAELPGIFSACARATAPKLSSLPQLPQSNWQLCHNCPSCGRRQHHSSVKRVRLSAATFLDHPPTKRSPPSLLDSSKSLNLLNKNTLADLSSRVSFRYLAMSSSDHEAVRTKPQRSSSQMQRLFLGSDL